MNQTKILEASLLAFDKKPEVLLSQLKTLKKAGIDHIHYDVMDGIFVNNTSFEGEHLEVIKAMGFKISVHLMVEDVLSYVKKFLNYQIDYLTFHYEPISKLLAQELITLIKASEIQAGIAIKPKSKISDTIDLINMSDLITIMSVEPGMGGQAFIMDVIAKLKEVRELNPSVLIQIDGGINLATSALVRDETNLFVMGTYLLNHLDEASQILEEIIR
ncbi:MAG: ribulose-phosphate 3-epimerase [Mycoplasmoidaceae bacterium]